MSDTIASVLRSQPDWDALGPQVPEPITTLLRRCLQKDHKRRLPDIGDARIEIHDADTKADLDKAVPVSDPLPLAAAAHGWHG